MVSGYCVSYKNPVIVHVQPSRIDMQTLEIRNSKRRASSVLIALLTGIGIAVGVTSLAGCKKKPKGSESSDYLSIEVGDPGKPPTPNQPLVTVFAQVRAKDPGMPTPDLRNVLNDLDNKDPGWRINDIDGRRPVLEPEKNGAIYALHVMDTASDNIKEIEDPFQGPHHQISKDECKRFVDELRTQAQPLAEARKLRDFPQGRFRLEIKANTMDTLLPHLQKIRKVARLLLFDAYRLAEKGDVDECLDDVKAMIYLTRYGAWEPTTIAQLVRVVILVMTLEALEYGLASKANASDKKLAEIQSLLEEDGNWNAV